MSIIESILLAVIEGLTEFLPVSSTAHMIFVSSMMGIQGDEFVKMFQSPFNSVLFWLLFGFFGRSSLTLSHLISM